jgi:anti-sigma regulatory factor (Ser/Thr protein kinase)
VVADGGAPGARLLCARGVLSARTAATLHRALVATLAGNHGVVLDASWLRLVDEPAVHLFTAAHAKAGGWPRARLVLCGADAVLAAALERRTSRLIPVYPTVDVAVARLDDRPGLVRQFVHLEADDSAPRRARAFVSAVCAAWRLPEELTDAGRMAASELVSNSVEHARSRASVTLDLGARGFRIAVRDRSTALPVRRAADPAGSRGRGLALIAALADDWGIVPQANGKTVWLLLRTPRPAQASMPA